MAEEKFRSMGFTVTPPFHEGMSPYTAEITLTGSLLVKDYYVDWTDGTEPSMGKFVQNGEYMTVKLTHTFTYAKGQSKYSGHAYYPMIVIGGISPTDERLINVFNTPQTGRCLSILVNSKPAE